MAPLAISRPGPATSSAVLSQPGAGGADFCPMARVAPGIVFLPRVILPSVLLSRKSSAGPGHRRRARAAGGHTLPWHRRQLPPLGLVAAAAAGRGESSGCAAAAALALDGPWFRCPPGSVPVAAAAGAR